MTKETKFDELVSDYEIDIVEGQISVTLNKTKLDELGVTAKDISKNLSKPPLKKACTVQPM